ncbi:GTP pyrophosphokinase [uncultured Anaerococcus sp.]|uniref:GTP pyrophosphokinase n=1 Tax=uncultured Anaerococcus sp. TaxID=293428 RepID=UPI0025EEC9B6|nr:GTP pyrophosphokinase [uncultured Anaerococcus sp.]
MFKYIRAFLIMTKAHYKQRDKGNHLYIFHPIRVSRKCKKKSAKLVALLHDVMEDNPNYTLEKFEFLNEDELEALVLLTHDENLSYFAYIDQIKTNKIAREVKLSDLKDNSNLNRLLTVTENDIKRLVKYCKAQRILLME